MQQIALGSNMVFVGIEYLAVLCWGVAGGLSAVKKGYDVFAILVAAWLTALGGGIIRDVLLGALPPAGISDKGLVLTALLSSILVAVAHPEVEKLKWPMLVTDAMGLGLFAVNGTAKALAYGTSGMTAVFLGMFTALAGGLIRDMLLNEVPQVIADKHWYAFPSFIGCVLTVIVARAVSYCQLGMGAAMALDVVIVVIVVAMRLVSVSFGIMLPGALQRRDDNQGKKDE